MYQPMTDAERAADVAEKLRPDYMILWVVLVVIMVVALAGGTAWLGQAERDEHMRRLQIAASAARVQVVQQTYSNGIWLTVLLDTATGRTYLRTSGPTPLVELVPAAPRVEE